MVSSSIKLDLSPENDHIDQYLDSTSEFVFFVILVFAQTISMKLRDGKLR